MQHGYGGYGPPPQGYGPPPKKSGLSAVAIIAIVVGVGFAGCMTCAVIGSAGKRSGEGTASTPAPATTREPEANKHAGEARSITAQALFEDYQANEVAADNKYKGKWLLVSGTVSSIDKSAFGALIVRLQTGNEFMSAMAEMDKSEKERVAVLNKGDQVRVLCKGRGIVIGMPSLTDCVFKP